METFIYLYCFVGAWMSGLMFADYSEHGYVRSFLCGMGIIYLWPVFLIISLTKRKPDLSLLEQLEHREDAKEIARLSKSGHTLHCAQRIVWGDGECECGLAP